MPENEELKPVAYSFELAELRTVDGDYTCFGKPQLSFEYPVIPDGAVRNLTPLYAHRIPTAADTPKPVDDDPQPAMPPEWASAERLAEWNREFAEWAARRRAAAPAAADTGLVERLTAERDEAQARYDSTFDQGVVLLRKLNKRTEQLAAAEQKLITAQETIARLRETLKAISRFQPNMTPVEAADYCMSLARAALTPEVTDGQ